MFEVVNYQFWKVGLFIPKHVLLIMNMLKNLGLSLLKVKITKCNMIV